MALLNQSRNCDFIHISAISHRGGEIDYWQWNVTKKPRAKASSITEQLARRQKKKAPPPQIFLFYQSFRIQKTVHLHREQHGAAKAADYVSSQRQHSCKMETLGIIVTSYPNAKRPFSLPALAPPEHSHLQHTSWMYSWPSVLLKVREGNL